MFKQILFLTVIVLIVNAKRHSAENTQAAFETCVKTKCAPELTACTKDAKCSPQIETCSKKIDPKATKELNKTNTEKCLKENGPADKLIKCIVDKKCPTPAVPATNYFEALFAAA